MKDEIILNALKAIIIIYVLFLAVIGFIFVYSLYINPNTFPPITNIAMYLQMNPLFAVAVAAAALIPLLLLIVLSSRTVQPQTHMQTSTQKNVAYIPRGQTIKPQKTSSTPTVAPTKAAVTEKPSNIDEKET